MRLIQLDIIEKEQAMKASVWVRCVSISLFIGELEIGSQKLIIRSARAGLALKSIRVSRHRFVNLGQM